MEPPVKHLVLFDGVCNLCNAVVRFILRHDRRKVFSFAPLQSELGRRIFRAHGLDSDAAETFLVVSAGRVLQRSDAALEVARHLGGPWRLCGAFRIIPRGGRDWLYSLLARHRYRLFGRRETCMIPTPEVRPRFLA
jgi:predicted DCC family thiol-disulfide oxidoreductase YuxK